MNKKVEKALSTHVDASGSHFDISDCPNLQQSAGHNTPLRCWNTDCQDRSFNSNDYSSTPMSYTDPGWSIRHKD